MKKRFIGLVCLLLSAAGALAAHWTVNPYAFQYDMTVYAVLQMEGKAVSSYTDYEMAAFCGKESRGVAKVQTASDGSKYLYLRIRSNELQGETFGFCVYQTSTGIETWLTETVNFEAESVVGTPSEPIILTLPHVAIPGDVNGDGKVNSSDVQHIYEYLAGQTVGVTLEKVDVNGDGKVNSSDVLRIYEVMSNK